MFLASSYSIPEDVDYKDNNLQLFLTFDNGETFEKIAEHVSLFEWANDSEEGQKSHIHPNRILLIRDKYQGKEFGQEKPELL